MKYRVDIPGGSHSSTCEFDDKTAASLYAEQFMRARIIEIPDEAPAAPRTKYHVYSEAAYCGTFDTRDHAERYIKAHPPVVGGEIVELSEEYTPADKLQVHGYGKLDANFTPHAMGAAVAEAYARKARESELAAGYLDQLFNEGGWQETMAGNIFMRSMRTVMRTVRIGVKNGSSVEDMTARATYILYGSMKAPPINKMNSIVGQIIRDMRPIDPLRWYVTIYSDGAPYIYTDFTALADAIAHIKTSVPNGKEYNVTLTSIRPENWPIGR